MNVELQTRKSLAVAEAEYRTAFEEYSAEVHQMQLLKSQPHDAATIDRAAKRVREAERKYRHFRDALADALLLTPDSEASVRSVAHAIWERAGRPSGTAESDWMLAERMLLVVK